jgi:RNA polymerase sigma-70 factor, ECF subfamily
MPDLTAQFEANRAHLRAVAYRMLGSRSEAEDAVQEAWVKLARSDVGDVNNLRGWLTTVIARVCLDMLRTRRSREVPIGSDLPEISGGGDAERQTMMGDAVGLAMLVVLETLAPAERVAFVLHDLFDLPFDEIAPIVGRSPAAARQLASRARRRVSGAPVANDTDRERQREIVDAFLAASRDGDFAGLLAVLDPDVALYADAAAVAASLARAGDGAPVLASVVRGANAVAQTFRGRARAAQLAMIDGAPGLVFAPGGRPFVVFDFVVEGGRITAIDLIGDPDTIARIDWEMWNPSLGAGGGHTL